jgi:hypothetical protein
MTDLAQDKTQDQTDQPHNLIRLALIECGGVRHLAFQDQTGKWRTVSRKKEFPGIVEVIRVVE